MGKLLRIYSVGDLLKLFLRADKLIQHKELRLTEQILTLLYDALMEDTQVPWYLGMVGLLAQPCSGPKLLINPVILGNVICHIFSGDEIEPQDPHTLICTLPLSHTLALT